MVVRDLRVLAQPLDGQVVRYRDNNSLEVDAVLTCDDGRWGAFEVRLGHARIEAAAKNLLALAGKIDTSACGQPGVLAVVTGTGLAYRRKDGVHVVPIGTLDPSPLAAREPRGALPLASGCVVRALVASRSPPIRSRVRPSGR